MSRCNALAFSEGVGVLSVPPAWWTWTTAPSGDLATTWQGREPDQLDERTIEMARATFRALVEDTREWGADLRYLYAHRQSSATRRSDPGEALWRALVPWAERELGLVARLDFTIGNGRPIPSAWDERAGVGY